MLVRPRVAQVLVLLVLGNVLVPSDGVGQGVSVDSLTVETAIQRVLETHPGLSAAHHEVEAATARLGQARSAWWPRVEAMGTYRRQDPVPEISVPGGLSGPGGAERTIGIQPHNLYDGHLQIQYTLYDFGTTSARVDQAEAGRTVARRSLDVRRRELTFRTIEAFYAILLADEQLWVQRQQIEQLEETLEVVGRQRDAGVATGFEVQSTQSRLTAARSRYTRFEHRRRQEEAELRRLLGRPREEPLALKGHLRTSPLDSVQLDTLTEHVRSRHPSVRQARVQLRAARRRVEMANEAHSPILALTAQGGVKNGYPSDLNEPRVNESVGLSLRVPLFSGFATRRGVEEAEADVRAAKARLTDVERQAVTRMEQAASALRARFDQLNAADTRVEQARSAAQQARTRYEAGTITNLELLEAETELQRARLERTQAEYEVVVGRYRLQRATGTLLPFSPLQ